MRDERRQYEFNDQQTAVLRNDCAAVPENSNSFRVPIPVQDMFEHVHIGAGRDRLAQVCGNEFASGGKIFIRKARFSCIQAGLAVDKHALQLGVESQYCKNERPTTPAEVSDHLVPQSVWASLRSGLPNGVSRKCSGVVSSVTPMLARARSRRYRASASA